MTLSWRRPRTPSYRWGERCHSRRRLGLRPITEVLIPTAVNLRDDGETAEPVSWELDGGKGTAKVGGAALAGFALMRDSAKHLITFHSTAYDIIGLAPQAPSTTEQFLVDEDAFEPTAVTWSAPKRY